MDATTQIVRVSEFLQDTGNVRWSAALVLKYLNDAQRDFARETNIGHRLSTALSLSPTGPAFYLLPTDFLELASGGVWTVYGTQNIPLDPITPAQIGGNWDMIVSDPPSAYIWPLEFNTTTEIRVWPTPTDGPLWVAATAYSVGQNVVNGATGGKVYTCTTAGTSAGSGGPTGTGTGITDGSVVWSYLRASRVVTLYYNYLPPDLVNLNTSISPIPQQYHMALVYYAVAMCYLQDGQFRDPSKYQLFESMYKRELVDCQQVAARRFSAHPVVAPWSNV